MNGQSRTLCQVMPLVLAGLLTAAGAGHANSTWIHVMNHSGQQLQIVSYRLDHGRWGYGPQTMITPGGQGAWESQSDGFMTGTEGSAELATYPNAAGTFHIHWDNPYIGSNSYDASANGPFIIRTYGDASGAGDDATMTYEIIPVQGPPVPPISIPGSGPGSLSGALRWKAIEGLPQLLPPGRTDYWSAVSITAQVPSRFKVTGGTAAPTNGTVYQGKGGYFEGSMAVGQLSCRPLAVSLGGDNGFAFTIANLPLDVPVQITIADARQFIWPPAPNNPPPPNLGPTAVYVRGFVPTNPFSGPIPQAQPSIVGVDFQAVGEWAKPPSGNDTGLGSNPLAGLRSRIKLAVSNPNPVSRFGAVGVRARVVTPVAPQILGGTAIQH